MQALTGSGTDTFIYSWAVAAGFDYIIPSENGADSVNLTIEQIYEFDPDLVLFSGYKNCLADAYALPEWQALRAGQENNLYQSPICLDVWAMPNSQCALLYEWALVTFYPEYAGDLDLVKDTMEFYKQFYSYDMTEEEVNAVLIGDRMYME